MFFLWCIRTKNFIREMTIWHSGTKWWQMKWHIISVEALLRNIQNILNQQCSSYLVNFVLRLHSYAVKKCSSKPGENKARRVNLPLCWYWWCLTYSSIFRLSSYMADINSNKIAIIIQPITLQIRAPFQFLTNQRAIKHTHYSEWRDGLNGRCSFSVVCAARK